MMLQKLLSLMSRCPEIDVRRAYIARMRDALGRKNTLARQMVASGFEPVQAAPGLMSDGRVAISMGERSWALRPDVHAERLAQAFDVVKKRQPDSETRSVVGSETLSKMVCPKCGDALQHTAVCPKCAAGKLGYRHRYTCVCGGVDMVSKEAL
jgi:Zn finger protein HypA/HybF involved in hydrogenase expression